MNSIRTKIILVVLLAVVLTGSILTGVSIRSISTLSEKDSDLLLEHICKQIAGNVNGNLESTEQVLGSIFYYAQENVAGNVEEYFSDEAWRADYLKKVEELALMEAVNTDGLEAVYFRVNTDVDKKDGFLYQYYDGTGRLEKRILRSVDQDRDISLWYYLPMESKEPMWIGPYDNYNIRMRTISYVMPFYVEDQFLGVFGIDIDIEVTSRDLGKIRVYSSGSVLLFDRDDNLVFHKSHVRGLSKEKFSGEQQNILKAAKRSAESGATVKYNRNAKLYAVYLQDGMLLTLMAPIEEINETQTLTIRYSLVIGLSVLILVSIAVLVVIRGFLRPLRELSLAAKELSNGNMDVEIREYPNRDEIGELFRAFSVMALSLKNYFEHFHSLAYTDNLTGINNKAAYETVKGVIESEISMGRASFGIVVMDVNNLKIINDSIGHEKGDVLLKHAALCMRQAFTGFPLYRIGGDEFVSIIKEGVSGEDLIRQLQEITAKKSEEDYPDFHVNYQIAAGYSFYEKEKDESFSDVFNRADQAMYENKKSLKEKQK